MTRNCRTRCAAARTSATCPFTDPTSVTVAKDPADRWFVTFQVDAPGPAPLDPPVTDDAALFFTKGSSFRFPITPPPLKNHGHYIISLSRFVKWLGGLVEAYTEVAKRLGIMSEGERPQGNGPVLVKG